MKKKLIEIISILVISSLCIAGNAYAVKNDNITSKKIKEADNTSGQDTNSGSGVKTGHIADGAVTDAKISDVSMAKVTGLDSALDEKSDAGHGHPLGNIAVVAISGGDYNNPATAMNDLVNWCGVPTAHDRCTIIIKPGRYDVSPIGPITMPPHVSLIGSGPESTIIQAEGINAIVGDSADVSIENFSIWGTDYGIFLDSASGSQGATIKNIKVLYTSNGTLIRNNQGTVIIDGGEYNNGVFVQGNSQAPGADVVIKNSTITTSNNPESAIAVDWVDKVKLSNLDIKGDFFENFQIHQVNEIMVNNLVGVGRVNSGAKKVYIRDSILGDPNDDVDVWLDQRSNGSMKIINTMMVNGNNGVHTYPNHGPIMLLNCYDHNLNPAVLLPAP